MGLGLRIQGRRRTRRERLERAARGQGRRAAGQTVDDKSAAYKEYSGVSVTKLEQQGYEVALCAEWRCPSGALCHVALPGWRFPGLPMWRFLGRKRHIGVHVPGYRYL